MTPADAHAPPATSTWSAVWRSAGARTFVLPITAGLGILNTRLIVENFGEDAYAQYGLLVNIAALLPFADLGMSAAIMNAVGGSADPSRDDHVRKVLLTSIRALLLSAAAILAIDLVISAFGWWPEVMGRGLLGSSGATAAAVCLALIAATLPAAFGQRVLTGLGKNHLAIVITNMQTPLVVVCILVIVASGAGDGAFLPVVPYSATLVLAVVTTIVAARMVSPVVARAIRDVPRRRAKGEKVADVAWPMLVQMIAVPIAMQTDRLVLSHLASPGDLAQYNLAAQMYLPVWQVVSAAGVALWPMFARARATGMREQRSPARIAAGFGIAAASVCILITVARPLLAELAADGRVQIPLSLGIAFSALMIAQAIKYPLGIYLTDAPGLRFQAVMITAMVPVNLGMSIVLAQRFGTIGPVIGSVVGVLLFEVTANAVYISRLRGGRPGEIPAP